MEVGQEFSNSCVECPYEQLLGNNWAMQCNMVGTSLVLLQFYEKGTIEHEAMWQCPVKCEKVNFFLC